MRTERVTAGSLWLRMMTDGQELILTPDVPPPAALSSQCTGHGVAALWYGYEALPIPTLRSSLANFEVFR